MYHKINNQICQDDVIVAMKTWSFGPVEDPPLEGGWPFLKGDRGFWLGEGISLINYSTLKNVSSNSGLPSYRFKNLPGIKSMFLKMDSSTSMPAFCRASQTFSGLGGHPFMAIISWMSGFSLCAWYIHFPNKIGFDKHPGIGRQMVQAVGEINRFSDRIKGLFVFDDRD